MIKETKGRRPVEHPELEDGQYWKAVPWSTWKGTGWRRGSLKACYWKAAMFAIKHPEVKYVEGFAFGPPNDVVYAHAWNVDVEGRVIERTWYQPDNWVEGMTYYGVVVEIKEVAKRILERDGHCSPFLPIVEEFQREAEEKEKEESWE